MKLASSNSALFPKVFRNIGKPNHAERKSKKSVPILRGRKRLSLLRFGITYGITLLPLSCRTRSGIPLFLLFQIIFGMTSGKFHIFCSHIMMILTKKMTDYNGKHYFIFVFEMKKSFAFWFVSLLTSTLANTSLALADQFVESSSFSPVLLHFQWRTPKPILKRQVKKEEDYVSLMQDFHDFQNHKEKTCFLRKNFLIVSEIFIAQEEDFLASVDILKREKQHISTVLQNNHHGFKKTYLLQMQIDTPVLVFLENQLLQVFLIPNHF